MISEKYIAPFSHFIPCGVREATYILDGLMENGSDIQPEIIHSDSHGQSEPVFGLAYLQGIKLMPRIKNWKRLAFYRPYKNTRYQHIDALFSDHIDWKLIAENFDEMLKVAVSIKAGKLSPSTVLRRLGSFNRQNRLYLAFRELGRVVRAEFLLNCPPPDEKGRNAVGRGYVGPPQPLFDRPRKQIRRVSVGFESATGADRLSTADPRILNRPEPARTGIIKD